MKELITISALSLFLAAGCASHQPARGGADDNTGGMSRDQNEAVHPGTALGTSPSEDPPNPSGGAVAPDQQPNGDPSAEPDQHSPAQGNPGAEGPGRPTPDDGTGGQGLNPEGPGMFNLHHTILMISI